MRLKNGLISAVAGILAAANGCSGPGAGQPDDGGLRVCASSHDCAGGEKCLEGFCREESYCEKDAHCREGDFCNQVTRICTPAECVSDQDCQAGHLCRDWHCRSLCEEAACPLEEYCDSQTGECVPLSCNVSTTQCQDDQDCPEELRCDPVAFGCTECPSGSFCNIHSCMALAPECNTHSECAADQRCGPVSGRCEDYPESCETDLDCLPRYCNLFTLTCQEEPFTGECQTDQDCIQMVGEEYYCHPRLFNCVLPLGPGQCYDTRDCWDATLVCNLATNQCAERGTICGVDSDCEIGHICVNSICVYDCQLPCGSDDECGAGLVCENHCCGIDSNCHADSECPPDNYCLQGWCQQAADCASDDEFEDNEFMRDAVFIEFPPLGEAQEYPDLLICPTDRDWYAVEVPSGQKLSATIEFQNSQANLDLWLMADPGFHLVDSSTSQTMDRETVVVDPPFLEDQIFLLKVSAEWGTLTSYRLIISHEESGQHPCSPDDHFEENDFAAAATPLPLPAAGSADDYPDLIRCRADEDWYRFEVPSSEALSVSITFNELQGDLSLMLLDSQGVEIKRSTGSGGTEEIGVWRWYQDSTFFVRVYDFYTYPVDYHLRVENPGGVGHDCTDGGDEPNDSADQASMVEAANPRIKFICSGSPNDVDWYQIEVPSGCRLRTRIEFMEFDGNLNLYLYEMDGVTMLDHSDVNFEGVEEVSGPRVSADVSYLLEVRPDSLQGDTPYIFTVEIDPPVDCSDGGFEANNSSSSATAIGAGGYSGMYICDNYDVDWYSIDLQAGERLFVNMSIDLEGMSAMQMELFEADGSTLIDDAISMQGDHMGVESQLVSAPTTLLLKVQSMFQMFSTGYELSVILDSPNS